MIKDLSLVKQKRKKNTKVFNVPLLSLFFVLVVIIAEIIYFLGYLSGFYFFKVISFCIVLFGFFLCLYIVGKCFFLFV
jgi:hypothetical protein